MKGTFLLTLWVSATIFSLWIPHAVLVEADENIIRVPSDFSTIQEAINASPLGSMILVTGGTYHEHLIVNKAVRLVGVDRTNTIVDGDNNGTAITVAADNVLIDGFTIRNCSEEPYSFNHGSIHLLQCENCTISNNLVTQNVCHGIYLEHSDNNTVLNNIVTLNGGASTENSLGASESVLTNHQTTR